MAEWEKNKPIDGAGEEDFNYDPEGKDSEKNAKYRLPFALCKQHGINIQDWWTPRDAWNALKKKGAVEDVDEEYAKRRREAKKKASKEYQQEHREEKKERQKLIAAQMQNPEHIPEKITEHQNGTIAGVEKGAPMTFEQADSGHVNPYYADNVAGKTIGYQTNCQTCVATFVARKLGYNVRALPNLNNKAIYALSYKVEMAYVDKDGNPPKRISVNKRDIKNVVKEGGIYALRGTWNGKRSGHIVMVENVGGNISCYDPQTNERKSINYFMDFMKDREVLDLTNCTMNETVCDKIMKPVKG